MSEEIGKLKERTRMFLKKDFQQYQDEIQEGDTEPHIETFLEEKEIVEMIIELLEHKKCPLGDFTINFLKDQLGNYVRHPNHQKWSPQVIKFCILVKFYGRKKLYEILRGKGRKKKKGLKGFEEEYNNFNLLLPSFKHIQNYCLRSSCTIGVDLEFFNLVKQNVIDIQNKKNGIFGLIMDEKNLESRLEFVSYLNKIVGFDEDITIDNIDNFIQKMTNQFNKTANQDQNTTQSSTSMSQEIPQNSQQTTQHPSQSQFTQNEEINEKEDLEDENSQESIQDEIPPNDSRTQKLGHIISDRIATKMMQVMLVSCTHGFIVPLASYPTSGCGPEKVKKIFSQKIINK